MDRILVAVDLETTGYEAETEEIIEIGAIRLTVTRDGAVTLGERFLTFANPDRPLTAPIVRLTGIRDEDLRGAPTSEDAVARFVAFAFRDGPPCFVGHNVGFDVSFLERAGMPIGSDTLDTAELASILLPSASSYALQRLAADASITPDAAHRALDDAITSALVLGHLARLARELPVDVLAEIAALSELLGPSTAEFFRDAAGTATRDAWTDDTAQRGGLLSERPLAGGPLRSHEGPSEEDPALQLTRRRCRSRPCSRRPARSRRSSTDTRIVPNSANSPRRSSGHSRMAAHSLPRLAPGWGSPSRTSCRRSPRLCWEKE